MQTELTQTGPLLDAKGTTRSNRLGAAARA